MPTIDYRSSTGRVKILGPCLQNVPKAVEVSSVTRASLQEELESGALSRSPSTWPSAAVRVVVVKGSIVQAGAVASRAGEVGVVAQGILACLPLVCMCVGGGGG